MAEDLSGTEILNYRLVEFLGDGGMGVVWRAEHTTLSKTVAIKLLDPGLARQSGVVERFRVEAQLQNALEHPHIVRVENFSLEPLSMVMEYVGGGALDQVIERTGGPLPWSEAWPLMSQILDGVDYAHGRGVVHRDLKPSNILLTTDGRAKVMDFGIAKVLGAASGTRTGATMGTPEYMAPEQVRHAKEADERTDIYALGITFYEMLAGRPPFVEGDKDTPSSFDVMDAQVRRPPPDPRDLSTGLAPGTPGAVVGVLLQALAKEPDERFPSVAAFRAALAAAAGRPALR